MKRLDNENEIADGENKVNTKLLMCILLAAVCVVILGFTVFMLILSNKYKALIEQSSSESIEGKGKKSKVENAMDDVPSDLQENSENAGADNSEAEETGDELEKVYYICVPVDEMSLRKTAGLGDDVILTLKAGNVVEYLGKTETINGIDFYLVKPLDSDETGYVSSKYVVNYVNDYDEGKLTIVDTSIQKYSYDMMVDDIYNLVDAYKDIISYEVIGQSVYGRNLYALTLGNKDASNHIFIQAAIHGREYMTAQVVMSLLEYYACYYDDASLSDRTYRDLFENTAIHVIPMSNPDGVTISQEGLLAMNDPEMYEHFKLAYEMDSYYLLYGLDSTGEYDWGDHYRDANFVRDENERRITFEEYQTMWKANGRGVDLNNNFDADWENIDLKQYATYGSYKGEYPESEPETQALVAYAQRYDYSCYISYHSRGQLVYYDCKGNTNAMSQAEDEFASSVSDIIGYEKVKTQNGYNVNLGGFGDWVQLKLNKLSVTIENGKKPCPLTVDEFKPIWLRHKELWANLADI